MYIGVYMYTHHVYTYMYIHDEYTYLHVKIQSQDLLTRGNMWYVFFLVRVTILSKILSSVKPMNHGNSHTSEIYPMVQHFYLFLRGNPQLSIWIEDHPDSQGNHVCKLSKLPGGKILDPREETHFC